MISTSAPRAHSVTEPAARAPASTSRAERGVVEIERGHVKARLHEVAAHRTAHVAEPDEPDPDHSATQVVFRCVYASSACSERSRPCPESLTPPNGVVSDDASNVLIQTVPARRRRANR